MKIDKNLMSYKRTAHYQKKFKEFEKVISDKRKESPKSKQIYESLKSSQSPEEQENFIKYEDFTFGFVYTDSKAVFDKYFYRSDFSYTGADAEKNDLTLIPGTDLPGKYGVTYTIGESHVSVNFGSRTLSDKQTREVLNTAGGLTRLIRYANGQNGAPNLEKDVENNILALFRTMGVNTKDPFIINGTEFTTSKFDWLEKAAVDHTQFNMLPDYLVKKQFDTYASELGITLDWDDEMFLSDN